MFQALTTILKDKFRTPAPEVYAEHKYQIENLHFKCLVAPEAWQTHGSGFAIFKTKNYVLLSEGFVRKCEAVLVASESQGLSSSSISNCSRRHFTVPHDYQVRKFPCKSFTIARMLAELPSL